MPLIDSMLSFLLLLALSATPAQQFQARMQEGMAALEQKNLTKAQASFEAATRLAHRQPEPWLLLPHTHAPPKNDKPAVAAAQKAEALGGNDPKILQGLANFY